MNGITVTYQKHPPDLIKLRLVHTVMTLIVIGYYMEQVVKSLGG